MYFSPKRDIWHGLVVFGTATFTLCLAFIKFCGTETQTAQWFSLFLLVPVSVFLLWFWFGTGYTVTQTELLVRFGPFYQQIALTSINEVRKPRFPLSSAALAFDRLEIRYGRYNSVIHISPLAEGQFVEVLKERCPQAEFRV